MDSNLNATNSGAYKVDIISQLFGVTVRRIQQLTQEGVLPTIETPEGRRYDLVPTIQRYVKYLSDKAYGKRGTSEREAELKEQKIKAEIALKESQGELHRLKTEIAAGKYISIEEVALDYSRFFLVFKKFAQSIPARAIGALGNAIDPMESRRLEKQLQDEVRDALTSFVVAGVTELKPKRKRKPKAQEEGTADGSQEAAPQI